MRNLPDQVRDRLRLRAAKAGTGTEDLYRQIAGSGITIVPSHGEGATLAAGLVPLTRAVGTRAVGMSLGDRACPARTLRQGVAAITADQAWSQRDLPIQVQVIRASAPP